MKAKFIIFYFFLLWVSGTAYTQKAQPTDPELQKLKTALATAKHDTARMMAYVDISSYFQKENQLDSLEAYVLKVKHIANKHPNYPKIAKVWNKVGVFYSRLIILGKNEVEKAYYDSLAQHYFKKAIKDAKRFGDEDYLVKSLFSLNMVYVRRNKQYSFLKGSIQLANYLEGKAKLSATDSATLLKTYGSLAGYLSYDMGSRLFNEYMAKTKKIIKRHDKDAEHLWLIEFEQHTSQYKKTDEEKLLQEYRKLKMDIKNSDFENRVDFYLASYYFNIGEYQKSLQISNQFVPNKELSTTDQLGLLSIYLINTGKCEYKLGRSKEALLHLTKALNLLNQVVSVLDLHDKKYTLLSFLSQAHQKQGNYQQAYQYLAQADTLYKEIRDQQRQSLIVENDIQLQQQKVQQARIQILLKEQEIETQKKQKYAFLAISILALLSTAWAVYGFTKTRKQNTIISQQAEALEESNLLKDKIFALLSHDLRSPINRLVSNLNQSIESQRTHIQVELKGVQDILNNVLYWASMQLKKATPVYTSMPLQPLADALIDEYKYALEEKNITFLNSIDKDCLIKTDEGYLKIVLRNLISNSIKFTPNQGYIQIDCNIKEKTAVIRLRDTGVGIAKEKLVSLFQLPMPSLGTNQEKGTGLGLSLSLDIVKKLGGNINIQSQEGKGTQVEVVLPVAA